VDPNLPLEAIAAVLLGGTALSGGVGGVGGTAVGVLFIGILQNGLIVAGVPSFWQQVGTGVILVLAILGDRLEVRRMLRTRRGSNGREPPGVGKSSASGSDTAPADAPVQPEAAVAQSQRSSTGDSTTERRSRASQG
jgi:hypothetical protein